MTIQAPGKSPPANSTPPPRPHRSPVAAPVAADYAGDARKLVQMVSSFLCSLSPHARGLWTEETCEKIAAVLQTVMEKHQWQLHELSPEIKLLLVAAPTLLASGQGISAEKPPPQADASPRRRAEDPPPERRNQTERRAHQRDRRASTPPNLIRPYRWNQFKT